MSQAHSVAMRVRALMLAAGWSMVAVIVTFSLLPEIPPNPMDFSFGDKVNHFIAYAAVTWWFSQLYDGRAHLYYAAGFTLMGLFLEVLQGMTGLREYELFDMYANTAGVIMGLAAARIVYLPRLVRAIR